MKVPNSVIWQVVKKNHAYFVKRGKRGDQFTKDPLSTTNLHNASQNGISNHGAVSIQSRQEKSKSDKTHRRVFDINVRHGGHHSAKKTGGAVYSKTTVKKEINHLAKVVNSLQGITDNQRDQLLKRVHRLHAGNRPHTKKERTSKQAAQ